MSEELYEKETIDGFDVHENTGSLINLSKKLSIVCTGDKSRKYCRVEISQEAC
jgi:hypothetical protein